MYEREVNAVSVFRYRALMATGGSKDLLTGHFGTKTVRHQYRMVLKCLETIRHQIFTGAELSGHFGTSAEIPRNTSAPSVKNIYGLLFRQNRPTLSTMPRFTDPTNSPAVSNRQCINLMRDKTCVK